MIGSLALLAFVIGYHYYDIPSLQRSIDHQINNTSVSGSYIPWVGRTMAFAVLSLSQLFHSFNMRSEHSLSDIGIMTNRKLVYSFLICGLLQVSVITIPTLSSIFQVVPLTLRQWSMVLFLSFVPIIVVELQKKLNLRSKRIHRSLTMKLSKLRQEAE